MEHINLYVPRGKTMLQRRIETADKHINEVVYELYKLTGDEIKIVEEAKK